MRDLEKRGERLRGGGRLSLHNTRFSPFYNLLLSKIRLKGELDSAFEKHREEEEKWRKGEKKNGERKIFSRRFGDADWSAIATKKKKKKKKKRKEGKAL